MIFKFVQVCGSSDGPVVEMGTEGSSPTQMLVDTSLSSHWFTLDCISKLPIAKTLLNL